MVGLNATCHRPWLPYVAQPLYCDKLIYSYLLGVMNTDNFSILGLTIDYGPYQFMDVYEPDYICNHTDEGSLWDKNNHCSAHWVPVSLIWALLIASTYTLTQGGRYAYNEQPNVSYWNVGRLASALSGLVVDEFGGDTKQAETVLLNVLNQFQPLLEEEYVLMMRKVRVCLLCLSFLLL